MREAMHCWRRACIVRKPTSGSTLMRRPNHKHWATSLPESSEALSDLDAFCNEMGGIERSEATRFILIAWSKARRGQFTAMWGFGSQMPASQAMVVSTEPVPPKETKLSKTTKKRVSDS